MENRELWEYDLRLSSAQVQRFMDHLWELGHTTFDYFFLTENCSYQLLPLLEVADPSRGLSEGFQWKAIPVDTLRRVLASPGFVEDRRVRPPRIQEVLARRACLTGPERRWVEEIGKTGRREVLERVVAFPMDRRGLLLESAYDYFRLRHKFGRYESASTEEFERLLLLKRGQLPPTKEEPPARRPSSQAPESGHLTGRISFGGGWARGDSFEEIDLRPAMHDLTDPAPGYPLGSQLHMFGLKGRFKNSGGPLSLEKGTLVEIVSLTPWDGWTRPPSWKFFMGWERARELGRAPPGGLAFSLNGGSGLSGETPWPLPGLMFFRVEGDLGVGGVFRENARLGLGATAGLLFPSHRRWRTSLEGGGRRYFWGDLRTVTRWGWVNSFSLNSRWALRWEISRVGVSRETVVMANYYL